MIIKLISCYNALSIIKAVDLIFFNLLKYCIPYKIKSIEKTFSALKSDVLT